jgi:tripartite-type tricarboxylate transporter receptor subunit TctC
MKICVSAISIMAAVLLAASAGAQTSSLDYPSQTVRIVVPISAGSITDTLARMMADKLQGLWRQQVVVENRPGIPGTASVAKSPADGYTMIVASNGHAVLGAINKNLPFDPVKDFAGVTQVASVPFILVTDPAVPAKTVKELIELAKDKPGTLNIALPGVGTAASIASELFRREAKVAIVAVPYRGAPEAHGAVLRGDAHIFFSTIPTGLEHIQAGKVRPLAVTATARLAKLPDLPTFAEAGMPNFAYDAWFGIMVPAGTPRPTVERLDRDIKAVLALPDIRQRLDQLGIEPRLSGPDEFDAVIRADTERLGPLFQGYGSAN